MLSDDIPRTAVLMSEVNLSGALLHLLLGTLYLAPVFAGVQGFPVGGMLSLVRSGRAYLFSAMVLPLEAGAFSLAGGLGMRLADRWLLQRCGLRRGVVETWPELKVGLPLVVLLQASGGLLEAVGAITFRLPGVISREQMARAVGIAVS